MKKLIVLSVIFALVAGAVFAQNFGGAVYANAKLAEGSNADGDDDARASGGITRARLQITGENEEGTFGGLIRLDSMGNEKYAFGWWKPIDMLRLQIGRNGDGDFGADGVARWAFWGEAGDVGIIGETWKYSAAFFGGFGAGGLVLTLTPMDGLAINVGIPYFEGGPLAEHVYKKTNAQVKYSMEGLGTFALTYVGGAGEIKAVPATAGTTFTIIDDEGNEWEVPLADLAGAGITGTMGGGSAATYDPASILAYFQLDMIENLNVHFGFGYKFNGAGGDKDWKNPMAIGLGAQYDMDPFGVKARFMVQLGGDDKGLKIDADVLPYYAISESLKAFLSAGIDMYNPDKGDNVLGWHIQPYLAISEGGCTFYAGFGLNGTNKNNGNDAVMNWSIPIGIAYNF